MSSVHSNYIWNQVINELLQGKNRAQVATNFHDRVLQIDKQFENDKSSLLVTMVNFMVQSGTVDFRFETGNINFNEKLISWKNNINKNVGLDIPIGLRSITQQYLKERYRTSLIVLNIQWGNIDGYILPINMWLSDGGSIYIDGDASKLGGYNYYVGKNNLNKKKKIIRSLNRTIIIRKPFESLVKKYPSPYLVKKGALYHALVKSEILGKQSDLINTIVPYILLAKAGTDQQALANKLPTEDELMSLKAEILQMTHDYNNSTVKGQNVGAFPYDVSVEHLIPDLTKFLNDTILKPSDKNLLSALGLIELEGFSKSRQETILNPKVMVEEVIDAVLDWKDILHQISVEMIDRNKKKHPKIEKDIKVIPGVIKSFLTNDDKVLIRSAFDRGSIGHQDFIEILPFDFETVLQRRLKERDEDIDRILYPHVIMNQEQNPVDDSVQPEQVKEESPEKKKTEKDIEASTHEIEDFMALYKCKCIKCGKEMSSSKHCKDLTCSSCGGEMRRADKPGTGEKASVEEYVQAPYENIDSLPDNVKNVLPVGGQIIWLNAFNSALEDGKSEDSARKIAWSAVKKKYKKVKDKKKWVKK